MDLAHICALFQLSAAILRQITYSTTRFGIYEELKSRFTSSSSPPGLPILVAIACASGFIGGFAGNPADVLNVRMQHDAALPPAQRRNYKHALHGLVQMTRTEGAASLFRGVWPNSTRAVLMTASQLASYDSFKRLCLEKLGMSDNLVTHFTASLMAGFVATTVCSPVDVIKTRVMTASPTQTRGHSLLGLLRDIYRKEGFAWVFRGWVPSFIRLGPHTIATFIFLEEHKKLYRALKGISGTTPSKYRLFFFCSSILFLGVRFYVDFTYMASGETYWEGKSLVRCCT
ncbi:putative mitochondrial dicarboxylate carrier [Aspergillus novofumigatus IBT 16806]|uniref:Mitochondrial dicarboxylate carrier n=1 Tax=Aspergillus novofumigatus (strain IBT 16806) TaxID=1392255 RepID=A0A2I1CNB3_ASPN1|nr:mitochondrial dicarboxylate carrier [Aspergillus novofumigatus IBT 16806]PKX99106.1 mitochondrial dicarboxylate carrier [Aspergillus novofumigatus IBT 16806]